EYLAVLKRMDIISLIVIIILGLATFPLAFFVYYKLLTTHTFKLNYTFLLIVVAGIVDFLVYLFYLIFLQLSTFTVMNEFFEFINRNGLSPIASGFMFVLSFLQILLSLSIAVNRLLFITKRHLLQEHGRAVFVCSIVASLGFAVICSGIIYMPSFTFSRTYMGEGVYAHTPSGGTMPSFLSITLLTCSVSLVLLLVSLSLAGSVFKYRRQISLDKNRSIENGLIIVSISNFVIYILFVAALLLSMLVHHDCMCIALLVPSHIREINEKGDIHTKHHNS
ncbi:hypothetical protein PRIPAC_96411, partial [Pristionchus pacificus]|uniref:Uncharacterized protein n=1 Tax=Pristionchus pacificus TaxID=54126 RepID=A0A2A6CUW7_PRIPA